MAAVSAPSSKSGAKGSKKKAATKVVERADSPAPTASPAPEKETAEGQESSYVRELQKNIRNVNKKIANASKTDPLLEEHSGKTLDELVAARIINADQKAQVLKKPALKAQLAQLEEQLVQFKKVDADYQARLAAEKDSLKKELAEQQEKLEKEKADAVQEAKEKAEADIKVAVHDHLLVLSQFLRLAAARRAEEADPTLDENLALEGVLLAVYGGDESAVSTMLKLVEGSDDKTVNTSGEQLESTYAHIKSVAQTFLSSFDAPEEAEAKPVEAEAEVESEAASEAEAKVEPVEETTPNGETSAPAEHVNGVTPAAEAPAEEVASLSASQEWVDVSRPTEAESTADPTPATTQSWADDHPEPTPEAAAADPNDGFHQVQRHRAPQREGGGNAGGRGRGRGEWRGRGQRGDGRGRRGGGRGGNGSGQRGNRRAAEES
ncbi:uncharacterized protein DNG_06052 [Cephalotrichum gorgonifer]|uniref:YAG7-like dimerisation domain-containing protein n=1 Tax=Cephalotrichum gorgonifer TaxID=2041049 RepID=A0AAE8N0X9_9PEZI|nr:uncharacterized protein DNG_06052 [Cephalotrichum gorgonifer]